MVQKISLSQIFADNFCPARTNVFHSTGGMHKIIISDLCIHINHKLFIRFEFQFKRDQI